MIVCKKCGKFAKLKKVHYNMYKHGVDKALGNCTHCNKKNVELWFSDFQELGISSEDIDNIKGNTIFNFK